MEPTLGLRFDPDLPLFASVVGKYRVEIFFTGHKGNDTKAWTSFIDGKKATEGSLNDVLVQLQEIFKKKFRKEIIFYFPTEQS